MQSNASIQSLDPLTENHFQSVIADFVHNFSDSRKKFICRPGLLFWETIFEMPKQEKVRKSEEAKFGSSSDAT
jgi:hypothetical protein